MKIGLCINPVAGMGGAVGLKGTDHVVREALNRGAIPHSQDKAVEALKKLKDLANLSIITCSGAMGENACAAAGVKVYRVVYTCGSTSNAQDTMEAARQFVNESVDMILFCGGDGTARDVFEAVGRSIPILGIPAGVKMYSAVFAVDPEAAAALAATGCSSLRDSDVMDIDEDTYRSGTLATRLYGVARTPALPGKVQSSKQVFEEEDEERAKKEIARFMNEVMLPDTLYILGAGTTTAAIAERLKVPKTLLGVDLVKGGRLVAADADERTILSCMEAETKVRIIVSPIGAQGFVLGRGNQQISAKVVRRAGTAGLICVATPHKMRETPTLYIDTGDPTLNSEFGPSIQVISGYRLAQRKQLYKNHATSD